jgi:adenosine 3'-phospho 5'-phosphosulfate transporter B3
MEKRRGFLTLTGLTFLIYGFYGVVQEGIFKTPGFTFGWFLTFVQTFSYMTLTLLENGIGTSGSSSGSASLTTLFNKRSTSLSYYLVLACSIVAASGFSNASLSYLNYPTQILFKSSKLIPVMLGSTLVLRKRYHFLEYLAAFFLCIGVAGFTLGDFNVMPSFNPTGLLLISLGLTADAFVGPIQVTFIHRPSRDGLG